jgi:WD40 repeat protein
MIMIIGNLAGVYAQEFALPNEPLMTLGRGYITNVQHSPDGKYLAVATSFNVELLETQNYQRVRSWDGRAKAISFSHDSRLLAAAWGNDQIRILEVESGKMRILRESGSYVYCLSFRPDGKLLTWTDDWFIRVWDADLGKEIKAVNTILSGYWPSSAAFSPDGRFLAFRRDDPGSWGNILEVWDANTGSKLKELKGHTNWIRSLAFSFDGKKLASIVGDCGEFILWDIESGASNVIAKVGCDILGFTSAYNIVAFSSDGKFLAWAFGNAVGFMDIAKQRSRMFEAPTHTLISLSFSPGGKFLAASQTELVVWDTLALFGWGAPVGKKLETTQGLLAPVASISFSKDGRLLASGSQYSGEVDLWDIPNGGRKRPLQGHSPCWDTRVVFSSSGRVVFSSSGKSLGIGHDPCGEPIVEWDVESGAKLKEFPSVPLTSLALSPDNKFLAVGHQELSHGAVSIFDTATRERVNTLKSAEPGLGAPALVFSTDSKVLAAIAYDTRNWQGNVRLWDIASGNELKQLGEMRGGWGPAAIAYHPNGSLLASSIGGLVLWDVATGKEVANLSPNSSPNSIAFSPDGRFLVAGFGDGTIGLWDSGWRVNVPWKHTDVNSVAFSGDGRLFASGSSDGTIKIWEISQESSEPNNPPEKPSNLTPADKAQDTALMLEASPFSDKDTGDTLRASQWQITDKAGNYVLPIFDSGVIFSDKRIFTVPSGILKPNMTYFWHVRYQDNRSAWSEYSIETSFTTGSDISTDVKAFTMSLGAGLHIISLPLKPSESLTARSFAEMLGATLVIEYDEATKEFSAFLPKIATTDGFQIRGGFGYIVNLLSATDVTFTGQAWTNAAPSRSSLESAEAQGCWAFAVGGIITPSTHCDFAEPLTVMVMNQRTGARASTTVGSAGAGRYTATFLDMAQADVVREEDVIKVTVKDAKGAIVAGPIQRDVRKQEIRNAFLFVNLRTHPQPLPRGEREVIPTATRLWQNYPNPFNPETWVPYELAEEAEVTIRIYDLQGRLVRKLALGHQPAGNYVNRHAAAYWNGRNNAGEKVASGVYLYVMEAENFRAAKRMTVMK